MGKDSNLIKANQHIEELINKLCVYDLHLERTKEELLDKYIVVKKNNVLSKKKLKNLDDLNMIREIESKKKGIKYTVHVRIENETKYIGSSFVLSEAVKIRNDKLKEIGRYE